MSQTSSPTKRYRVEIFSKKLLDCPCPSCNGWLRLFADAETPDRPNYVKCSSEDSSGTPPSTCTAKVMFSKFETICSSCSKPIMKHSVIASSRGGNVWVHCRCYKGEKTYFAICQRCRSFIESEAASAPTACGGTQGYCHKTCVPSKTNKRLPVEDDDISLSCAESSQDTFVSESVTNAKRQRK